jgi:hypothetical protein
MKISAKATLVALVLSLGFAAPLAADVRADLAAAGEAYKHKDHAMALRLLGPSAKQGLVNAQYVLGFM